MKQVSTENGNVWALLLLGKSDHPPTWAKTYFFFLGLFWLCGGLLLVYAVQRFDILTIWAFIAAGANLERSSPSSPA